MAFLGVFLFMHFLLVYYWIISILERNVLERQLEKQIFFYWRCCMIRKLNFSIVDYITKKHVHHSSECCNTFNFLITTTFLLQSWKIPVTVSVLLASKWTPQNPVETNMMKLLRNFFFAHKENFSSLCARHDS